MKASVQYNDLIGTSAADISDFSNNSLQEHLKRHYPSFAADRFKCIGCRIYIVGDLKEPSGSVEFICEDLEKKKYVYLMSNKEFSLVDIFSLFKRCEVVLTNKNIDQSDLIVEEYESMESLD